MAFLGDLLIRLKVETADFAQDMGKAVHVVEQAERKMVKSLKSVEGALASIGVAASAGAFVLLVEKQIEAADAAYKMGQKLGIAAGEVTALKYAAELSDVPMEMLAAGMKKYATNVVLAAAGNKEAQKGFKALGIDVASTASPLEGLLKIADRVQKMPDGFEKSALASRAFGKAAGPDLIPLLNLGSQGIRELMEEARKLGIVLGEEAYDKAEAFQDNLKRFKALNQGIVAQIAGSLLPVLVDLQRWMLKNATASDSMKSRALEMAKTQNQIEEWAVNVLRSFAFVADAADGLVGVLNAVGLGVVAIVDAAANMGKVVMYTAGGPISWVLNRKEIAEAFGDAKAAIVNGFGAIGEELKRRGTKYREMLNEFLVGRLSLPILKPTARGTDRPDISQLGGSEAEEKRFIAARQRLEEMLGKANNWSQVEKTRYETTTGSLRDLTSAHKEELLALAKDVDLRQQNIARIEAQYAAMKSLQEATAAADDAQGDFQRMQAQALNTENFRIEMLGKASTETTKLTKLREIDLAVQQAQGKIDGELFPERVARIAELGEALKKHWLDMIDRARQKERDWLTGSRTFFNEYADMVADKAAQVRDLLSNAFRSAEDALLEFVRTGKLNFRSLADSIINDLARIYIKQNITGPIADAMKGALPGLTGLFAGAAKSNALAQPDFSGGYYAQGGRPPVGRASVVGENGPELFVPDVAGRIVPMGDGGSAAAGGARNVSVSFNIVANDTRGFDQLLASRQSLIVGIINRAMEKSGQAAGLTA